MKEGTFPEEASPPLRELWRKSWWRHQRLLFPFSSRTTLLVELSCEDSQELSYLPGEHLGVFPGNQLALVQGILERVVDSPAPHQPVHLETLSERGETLARWPQHPPCLLSSLPTPLFGLVPCLHRGRLTLSFLLSGWTTQA